MIKLNILNMNGFLQIVNQCSGAVNAIFPDGKRRDLNKSYAAQKVLWDQFRENQGEPGPETGFPRSRRII
ncbi:ribonuclease HII [Enterocloster bolteae]|uniref:ribonuclease HII n=1 Tax=Enterocloster bolteae TaxID=208479 RepID=UPI0039A35CA3